MLRRVWPLALAAVVVAVSGASAAPPSPRVEITQFKFVPAQLTVPVGTTVTWTNDDEEAHTVTATDRAYTSAGLDHAETYTHRFTKAGTYTYLCALHPHMTATITVK
jgi:plastocyanin